MQTGLKINSLYKKVLYMFIILLAYLLGEQTILENAYKKAFGNAPGTVEKVVFDNLVKEGDGFPLIGSFTVKHVVDGDTIHVENQNIGNDVVRIMAVNTLEKNDIDQMKKCFADKQTQFTKVNLLGKEVFLFKDNSQPNRDKYGRILAYVSTSSSPNGYFYNHLLVETGNADVYKASPKAILYEEFDVLKQKAQRSGLGMWSRNCTI